MIFFVKDGTKRNVVDSPSLHHGPGKNAAVLVDISNDVEEHEGHLHQVHGHSTQELSILVSMDVQIDFRSIILQCSITSPQTLTPALGLFCGNLSRIYAGEVVQPHDMIPAGDIPACINNNNIHVTSELAVGCILAHCCA